MSAWVATLIVGGVSLVGNLLATAYFYGRLSQRVDQNVSSISQLEESRKEQWREINQTAKSVEKLKGALGVNGG